MIQRTAYTSVDDYQPPKNTQENTLVQCIDCIISLVLIVLNIYVLVGSNTPALLDACGHGLWNVMLTDVLMGVIITVVACLTGLAVVLFGPCAMVLAVGLYIAMNIIMFSLEIAYSVPALQSANCTSAMSSATSINAPMLAIMGLISAGARGLFLLILTLACLCGGVKVLAELFYVV